MWKLNFNQGVKAMNCSVHWDAMENVTVGVLEVIWKPSKECTNPGQY